MTTEKLIKQRLGKDAFLSSIDFVVSLVDVFSKKASIPAKPFLLFGFRSAERKRSAVGRTRTYAPRGNLISSQTP